MPPRARPHALSYADAVRLLGADQSRLVRLLDLAAKAAAGFGTASTLGGLDLFAVREDAVKWGHEIVRSLRERITGISRMKRTDRLVAAHSIIVVTAFFEVLDEELQSANASLKLADLEINREEQVALAAGGSLPEHYRQLLGQLVSERIPLPSPHMPFESALHELDGYYKALAISLRRFVSGLAAWHEMDAGVRRRIEPSELDIAARAVSRYEELYLRLTADIPEFALWSGLRDHQATRRTVEGVGTELAVRLSALSTGLSGVRDLLQEMSGGRGATEARAELSAHYRAALDRPVLTERYPYPRVTLPPLADAYVNPHCRIALLGHDSLPASDDWWEEQAHPVEVQSGLLRHLSAPHAQSAPLVVLGHPGAGKSVLTTMLAAQLPANDFLPVRVELRAVAANASILDQVEEALRQRLQRRVEWRELADTADGALPVIMLDGFDELLQATGVHRSDYLNQVARFQQDSADRGRPVAAIVTSRTVVADRVLYPEGSAAMRLEPFDDDQVTAWLEVWNRTNADQLAARGVRPLTPEVALSQPELARQPLLLMLLALYDSAANALHGAAGLASADLYERLLTEFARREVRKHRPDLSSDDEENEIAEELDRLALVAVAMFVRRAQSVTESQLDRDLAVLRPGEPVAGGRGFSRPLTAAQIVVGRFFFVHESRATRDSEHERAFEFLHATFGEYLVARLVVHTLADLAVEHAAPARRRAHRTRPDDGFLFALLSFAVLTGREAQLDFTDDILARLPRDERHDCRAFTIELLADALDDQPTRAYRDYSPVRTPTSARLAAYSANLVALAVLASEGPLPVTDLLGVDEPRTPWSRYAHLWRGQLPIEEFNTFVDAFRVDWSSDYRLVIYRENGAPIILSDLRPGGRLFGSLATPDYLTDYRAPLESEFGLMMRRANFFQSYTRTASMHTLAPYAEYLGSGIGHWVYDFHSDHGVVDMATTGRLLLELRLRPISQSDIARRAALYQRCWELANGPDERVEWRGLVLRQLTEDAAQLNAEQMITIFNALDETAPLTPEDLIGVMRVFWRFHPAVQIFDDERALQVRELLITQGHPDPFPAGWVRDS
ncbi:NACHT domain-containing protein [Allonocardiopsis opalescens]|uniref:AAA+ ATPase domain-containing protein n=1 Tax=Allonocardiopsis opalescens TaxID=1144618 RepID=A0A2T0PXN1_9ACTN|nr:hypothetical protein [Allonocardiopsis opalescens]PRX96279.1 hypothetical protein CLV72_108286 [Allonocardiopsis opalescens]